MKTNIKNLATILATTIWADGEYDEAEKISVEEIAEAFELDVNELLAAVNAEVEAISALDEEKVNEVLLQKAAEVDEEEAELVLQAVLQIATVDGVLCEEEVDNILSIASALGVNEARAVLMLADLVKDEPELEIVF
ncbi:MAG: TerB family tellurite resistance protein [Bacteroidaceae bacterium]|jgi:tellurite resistance protein|nr:TerB family tellurite resistance protein [Bacteroidaceae bacterium]